TSFKGDDLGWSLWRVTKGHFLSASSEDAVLSMAGCESHSENFGGSLLLTRRANGWRMLWYKAGVQTSKCHKVSLPGGREGLVCMGKDGGQGFLTASLSFVD